MSLMCAACVQGNNASIGYAISTAQHVCIRVVMYFTASVSVFLKRLKQKSTDATDVCVRLPVDIFTTS